MIKQNELYLYANHFFNLGMNITVITNYLTEENFYCNNILKRPYHKWKHFKESRQTKEELINYDWENAVGIGTVCGFDGLLAIDIDGCINLDFLKKLLEAIKLPNDYEWIVKTGSGAGYHIFFKSPLSKNPYYKFDCASFEPNHIYANEFSKIEFISQSHVVLPPSKHSSGFQYEFINCLYPTSLPGALSFNLEDIVMDFCIGIQPNPSNSNWTIYSTPTKFIPVDFDDRELKNIILDVKSHSENLATGSIAHFCGMSGEINYDKMWKKLGLTDLHKYDNDDYKKKIALILDIETDGLIESDIYPNILQISWLIQISNERGTALKRNTELIKNEQLLKNKAQAFNNINIQDANKLGNNLKKVLLKLAKDLREVDILVAHNLKFDLRIIKHYFSQYDIICDFNRIKTICTMETTVGLFDGKPPTLEELHNKLYNFIPKKLHNAGIDVLLLARCVNKLFNES